MLIPSLEALSSSSQPSLSRRVNANSQQMQPKARLDAKLIKKGEC